VVRRYSGASRAARATITPRAYTARPSGARVYVSSCTRGWVATPGVHTLRWDYDYGSPVPDTDETNNSVTKVTTVADALPNSSYHIDAVADFDKDCHDDIVWRSYASGANALWVMDSSYHSTIVSLDALPGTNYELSGPR